MRVSIVILSLFLLAIPANANNFGVQQSLFAPQIQFQEQGGSCGVAPQIFAPQIVPQVFMQSAFVQPQLVPSFGFSAGFATNPFAVGFATNRVFAPRFGFNAGFGGVPFGTVAFNGVGIRGGVGGGLRPQGLFAARRPIAAAVARGAGRVLFGRSVFAPRRRP